jgi:hypothetical protein
MSDRSVIDDDAGMNERDSYHRLMNIEHYPAFYPNAREPADQYLAEGAATMMTLIGSEDGLSTPHHFALFEYSPAALDACLSEIYDDLMDDYRMSLDAAAQAGAISG